MCTQWRDIALIMRDEVFEKDEHDRIDVFDVQVMYIASKLIHASYAMSPEMFHMFCSVKSGVTFYDTCLAHNLEQEIMAI